ncbi:unnamed protein product [Rangifer tarandus platyrhynchus]|uniref:Uncharacterized protein n=2 Tax=Rangifer tarandus platyrhynchus TaxID=3082113 RepID=A0AC59ZZ99_RANTA|nr:unnamed protein product [Rangifer tarandus platyrhynchus]
MVLTYVVLNFIEFSEMMTIQIVITMFTSAKAMPTISGLPSGQWLFLNISKMRSLVMQLVKKIHLQCKRPGFEPWVGRSPGEGNGNPLQYSCLGNLMDRGAWQLQFIGSQESDMT